MTDNSVCKHVVETYLTDDDIKQDIKLLTRRKDEYVMIMET